MSELSKYTKQAEAAIRVEPFEDDFRTSFTRDIDRIINYASFTRYMNKTQVFSFKSNDNVQTRIVHVLLVSKISRTIGRALGLNEDLIEAIALGHDIGHIPLGHVGEKILNKISVKELDETFMHNIEGVRNYLYLEANGKGANLTIQVLDGILCHNGEILDSVYKPVHKTKEEFLKNYEDAYLMHKKHVSFNPMTLEGCVVKLSDVISYSGRDLEDAIRLGFVDRDKIPENITKVLGNTNKDIVNTLVLDVINNSKDINYIKLSHEVFVALKDLVKFNYEHIYNKANSKEKLAYYEEMFNTLYYSYLEALNKKDTSNSIYTNFLNSMDDGYKKTNPKRMVLDYISLMTDTYFLNEYNKLLETKKS